MPELTERQQQILDYVCNFSEENGWPPSIREIAKYFEMASTNGVFEHLQALEKKGRIWKGGGARQIRVLEAA